MTVAKKYNIRTKLSADRQKFYDNLSEIALFRFYRFALHGNCEKILARFVINLYEKKFADQPFIKLIKQSHADRNRWN